jgi:FKBP-type peptidyl-prolyl cis-trans isomerase
MSASTAAKSDSRRPGALRLLLALLAVIAAGVALAWFSAGSLRPEVTKSGLEFRVIKEGSGDPITDQDAAIIDYVLTGDDGTVIDSSQQHQTPQPFTTASVFPGFAEAMRRMRENGQYNFRMPQRLAFEGPPPPGFPPTKTLTFDVRVRKIVRGGAAMMGMMPPQR